MATLSIFSVKGGTGKSTIALNLGLELEKLLRPKRKRVCLIDGDVHVRSVELKLALVKKGDPGLIDVLDGRAGWRDALYPCCLADKRGKQLYPNLWIMPAGSEFLPYDDIQREDVWKQKVRVFQELMDGLNERFEHVIVDNPASFSPSHYLLNVASHAIVPVLNPNDDSLNSTKQGVDDLRSILTIVDIAGAIINRLEEGMDAGYWISRVEEAGLGEVFGVIPYDRYVDLAFSKNLPVCAYWPNSPAARILRSLSRKIASLVVSGIRADFVKVFEHTIDSLAREELKEMAKRKEFRAKKPRP